MYRIILVALTVLLLTCPVWGQTPNTWTELQNTNFSAWAVSSGLDAKHNLCQPSSSVGSFLGAWTSGAYHTGRKQWLGYRQGGHADGCLNGGLAFDPATKTWTILTETSPNAPKMTTASDDSLFLVKYPDGTPSSVHTYGTQFCITGGPLDGKCVTSGGIYWSKAGKSTPETPFIYDPSQLTAATAYLEKKTRPGGYGTVMGWNQTRQRAFLAGSAGAYEWDPVADVYTQLFTTSGAGTNSVVAIDEAAGRVYVLLGGAVGTLRYVDYATASTTKYQTLATTGGTGIENLAAPGFVFAGRDAQNRVRLVALGKATVTVQPIPPATTPATGDRAAIFVLLDDGVCGRGTATPCVWNRITPTNATNNLPPKPFQNGTWNKFFASGCDLYAIVTAEKQSATALPPNGDKGNVWSFRPDFTLPSCGVTPPPITKTLTIVAAGAGAGMTSGAGTYPLGTQVSVVQTPDQNSTALGLSGDVGCSSGTVTMDADKSCTSTFGLKVRILTLPTTGTGTGTVSGAGGYPHGTQAIISASPAAGSATAGVSGAGCPSQPGPVVMDADKTCTVTINDVQAPTVIISSPTAGQIVKTPLTIAYTATDNMPGATATLLLDGQPFTGQIDPATLTEGAHQLVVQVVDVAGNTSQAAVSFISVNCPVCRPPSAAILTIAKAGTGSGTVNGPSGAIRVGDPITLSPSPDLGSTYVGVAPALCGQAGFAMPPADLTCTFTFDLVPTYQLSVATAGTGTGTATGGGTYPAGAMVSIGGSPDEGSLDAGVGPAPCSRTPFPMPANDLLCTVTYNLAPPPTFPLTTSMTGQGMVSGAGNYAAGATVTLTATPATGQVFNGWSPVPCAPSFLMPPRAVACTAAFVAAPTGPTSDLAPRTWRGFPLTVLGQSKHARITYDSLRKVMVVAGGDGTDGSGNSFTGQNVFALDLATTTVWRKLHGTCPAPGGIMPPGADDVTLAYDPKRDQLVVMPAYYGATQTNCPAIYSGTVASIPQSNAISDPALAVAPIYAQQMVGRWVKFEGNVTTALKGKKVTIASYTPPTMTLNVYDASNVAISLPAAVGDRYSISIDEPVKQGWVFGMATSAWARGGWPAPPAANSGTATGWGGDIHDHFGVLDPVTDKVYRATNLCGMQIVPLDGSVGECLAFSFAGAPAGSWDPSNDQQTIDVQGRAIYWIARYKRSLVKWSIDQKKIVAMIPMPATWLAPTSEFGGGDYETHIAFDSKNRIIFIPNDVSYGCGNSTASCAPTSQGTLIDPTTTVNPVNRGVYFFAVDTNVWEWEAAPVGPKVSGNILGYDPTNNVFVYVGRSPTNQYWVYRYK